MDPQIRAFPSRDGEFVDFAQAAMAALARPKTPGALQAVLRARYPAAVVRVQEELARHGEGPMIWYAFRTAAIGGTSPDVEGAGESPEEAAWATLDDDRRFLEVSPALARIAELPAGAMIGYAVEEFSNPADPTIREDIARLWAEFRSRGALASTLRFNYRDGRPREIAYRLVADAAGPGRHRLTVVVLAQPTERTRSTVRRRRR